MQDFLFGCIAILGALTLYYIYDDLKFRFRLWQIRRATWRRIKHEIERGDGI